MSEILIINPGEKVTITLPEAAKSQQEYVITTAAGHRATIAVPENKDADIMRAALGTILLWSYDACGPADMPTAKEWLNKINQVATKALKGG